MTQVLSGQEARDRDRMRTEGVLARYPDLDAAELAALKHWFINEASAHDVALIACNEEIRAPYTRFRKEHLDRFTPRDIAIALVFLAACLAVLAGILALTPA